MEEMEETEEINFIDDFFLTSGSKHPSLMEVPFAIRKIPWESSELGKMYVQGKCNGVDEVLIEIDMWKLELPSEGKPKVVVRQVTGAWMELRKPRDFYLETMKVVLVGAYFLIFAKQSPNSSKGDVWRYLRKECGIFKAKPNQKDLIQSFLLCQSMVTSDPKLQESPIIPQFFPILSMTRRPQVTQGSDDNRERLHVSKECSAVPEAPTFEGQSSDTGTPSVEVLPSVVDISKGRASLQSTPKMHRPADCEASPPGVDILRGETSFQSTPKMHIPANCEASPPVVGTLGGETSLKSTPRTCTIVVFEASPPVADISKGGSSLQSTPKTLRTAECEATLLVADNLRAETSLQSIPRTRSLSEFATEVELPLSKRLTSESKKRKPGRSARRNSRRNRKRSVKDSVAGDVDWIDEPDVCAFCDDGVEKGDKLLCCDGPCMRSFHPTVYSGRQNKCPTLCLTKSAVSVETWICPNCEAGQHQCFACGKLGNSTTSTDSQEVFVCGAKQCKRFYHPVCVAKLLVPDLLVSELLVAEQKDLACRIQSKLETFICPLHNCASCNVDEDKTDPSLCLIKCRRCPKAWHEKCLPEVCRNQLWPLEGGKHVMYCGRHRLDPELLTPKRDHIKFPALKSAGRVRSPKFLRLLLSFIRPSSVDPGPGGGPHHRRAYQTVRDIISESCRTVTLESVKEGMGIFSTT